MLVFIGFLLLSTLRCVPMYLGFNHFSSFLHHFVLANLATSSKRVNGIFFIVILSLCIVAFSLLFSQAVEEMFAERIGHGYHVVQDEVLYKNLQQRNMHFECCPISSWFTGSAPEDLSLHPIHR